MKKMFFAALAATVLFASCNKEEASVKGDSWEGGKTTMGLTISLPTANGSRAADGDPINATAAESTIKSISVFIFKGDGTLATNGYKEFTSLTTQFTNDGSGNYTLNDSEKIETTSGVKRIYIAANLPSGTGSSVTTVAEFKALETSWDAAGETWADTSNKGYVMCSQEKNETLVGQEDLTAAAANTVSAALERVVSKVVVTVNNNTQKFTQTVNATPSDISVEYTILDWTPCLVAKSAYLAQNKAGTKLVTPNNNRTDWPTDLSGFMAVNTLAESGSWSSPAINSSYIGENAPEAMLYGEATNVMIRTRIAPAQRAYVNGSSALVWTSATVSDYVDGVYVVRSDDGSLYFCNSVSDVTAVSSKLTGPTYVHYPGRYAYFIVTLNAEKALPYTAMVYRNQFIHVEVTGIKEGKFGGALPGDGDGTTPPDPEDPDPEIPDPWNPEDPIIEEDACLIVKTSVAPWVYAANPIELGF